MGQQHERRDQVTKHWEGLPPGLSSVSPFSIRMSQSQVIISFETAWKVVRCTTSSNRAHLVDVRSWFHVDVVMTVLKP